jgi:6-phosphogluconolactonase
MIARICENQDDVADVALEHFRASFLQAVEARGRFDVALAGGSSPLTLYARLAESAADLPWERARVFFSDERYVPLDTPESNFGAAKIALLDHVPTHVFPVPVDAPTVEDAARWYQNQIVEALGETPVFDWILLGVGSDGHTASLFPGKPALHSRDWVTHSRPGVLPPPVDRVTFTFPLINQARAVVVLATGAAKAPVLAAWQNGGSNLETLPVIGIEPTNGELIVLADRACADGS